MSLSRCWWDRTVEPGVREPSPRSSSAMGLLCDLLLIFPRSPLLSPRDQPGVGGSSWIPGGGMSREAERLGGLSSC